MSTNPCPLCEVKIRLSGNEYVQCNHHAVAETMIEYFRMERNDFSVRKTTDAFGRHTFVFVYEGDFSIPPQELALTRQGGGYIVANQRNQSFFSPRSSIFGMIGGLWVVGEEIYPPLEPEPEDVEEVLA